MATKRPGNPYEGFISALFKDASEVIKDTAKKSQPGTEDVSNNPVNATLNILPSIRPSITPNADDALKANPINVLDKQTKDRADDDARDQTKDRAQEQAVLRTLDLVPKRESLQVDSEKRAGALETPSPMDGGDGSISVKGQTKDQTGYHTEYHTPSGFEIYPLTDFQRKVLIFLVEKEKKVTAMREIAAHTGISYNSIRKILKVLFSNRLIVKDKVKFVSGKFQGFRYTVGESACRKALEGHIGYHTEYHAEGQTMAGNPVPLEAKEASAMVQHLVVHSAESYPNIHALGLRRKDIAEIVQCWKAQSYDLAKIADSFEAADWDLAHNDDGHIQTPAIYVRKALKNGPYTFPKGFKSRRQVQAEQEARLAEECRKHLEKVIDDCFYLWWTQMAPEERKQIDAEVGKTNKLMPSLGDGQKDIMRQQYFREHVYSAAIKDRLFSQK
ncbi:MAG: winged helix-turn-helix domain-containing protein [Syntrophaceae bacterium]|nr:winged helix-turn-helix domain-containing protein [Syntrophaceae bacterium]